jgi:hypothetical protein
MVVVEVVSAPAVLRGQIGIRVVDYGRRRVRVLTTGCRLEATRFRRAREPASIRILLSAAMHPRSIVRTLRPGMTITSSKKTFVGANEARRLTMLS